METVYEKCKVVRVIDGDTVVMDIDLGFYIRTQKVIRLLGINTPEIRTKDKTKKAQGILAKRFVQEQLHRNGRLVLVVHEKGKYGRWVGNIVFPENEHKTITSLLLNAGLAEKVDY